jgi:hypothetical protein
VYTGTEVASSASRFKHDGTDRSLQSIQFTGNPFSIWHEGATPSSQGFFGSIVEGNELSEQRFVFGCAGPAVHVSSAARTDSNATTATRQLAFCELVMRKVMWPNIPIAQVSCHLVICQRHWYV